MSLDHKDSSYDAPGQTDSADPKPGKKKLIADQLLPFIKKIFGGLPKVRIEFWDGSYIGDQAGKECIRVTSPRVMRQLLWSPNELGLGRAYVTGDLAVEGDIFRLLELLDAQLPRYVRMTPKEISELFVASLKIGAVGTKPKPPEEEFRPHRRGLHTERRDAKVIRHHYDVSNNFYRLILGETMTYSCARFTDNNVTLDQAQDSKYDMICAKLGFRERPGLRLLDIGCGWGSMVIYAAKRYKALAVGITLSEEQASYAKERVKRLGLEDRVEIRIQDYRSIANERFDAVSSIGMFEHVGSLRADEYFARIKSLLSPGGRLCNHAISKPGRSKLGDKTFANRYVFPDGELQDVGHVVLMMEKAGFEVRDVESLREHYKRTLRCWVNNLESNYDEAVRLVGEHRARIWRLYMAASANGFEHNHMSVHQVLGVVPTADGKSLMPPTRSIWE